MDSYTFKRFCSVGKLMKSATWSKQQQGRVMDLHQQDGQKTVSSNGRTGMRSYISKSHQSMISFKMKGKSKRRKQIRSKNNMRRRSREQRKPSRRSKIMRAKHTKQLRKHRHQEASISRKRCYQNMLKSGS